MKRLFLFLVLPVLLVSADDGLVDVFSANATAGGNTYFCIKIPTLLEHPPTGSLIALGEGRVGSCADVAWTDLLIRRSVDGGRSWSPLAVLFSNSSNSSSNVVGNAAPVVDAATGRIWLPFNRNNRETWLSSSDDGGLTWAAPSLRPELQRPSWKWVGVGPPGGLQLSGSSGRLLVPGYHSEVWPDPNKSSIGSGVTKGHVIVSDDHGDTWRLAADDFGHEHEEEEDEERSLSAAAAAEKRLLDRFFVNEQQAAQLPSGRVVVNSRTLSDRRAISWSDDGGETFYAPSSSSPSVSRPEGGSSSSSSSSNGSNGSNDTPQAALATGVFETWQGCEGSTVFHASSGLLVYSGVQGSPPARLYREDLALFNSSDGGLSWRRAATVWAGSAGYSALVATTNTTTASSSSATGSSNGEGSGLAILFERSNCKGKGPGGCPLIFLPEHISFKRLLY